MYNVIFVASVLRQLDEQRMTRKELSERSGVSLSFLSELTNGKANPSLNVMEDIAGALGVPLPVLLESADRELQLPDARASGVSPRGLPPGYERVAAVLPEHQAFIVRRWSEACRKKLRDQ